MSARNWLLFGLVAALWGVPYYLIKLALDAGAGPLVVAWARVGLAALVLMALATRRQLLRDLRGRWHWVAAVAVLDIAAPFALVPVAERDISSALSGILVAGTPLFVVLLALRFDPGERLRGVRLAGLLAGFAGVVVVLGVGIGARADMLIGGALVLLAACGYAAATLIVKRALADVPPLAVSAVALAIAAVLLTPTAAITAPGRVPSVIGLLALLALGLICTAAALLSYYALIGRAGAGRAALTTYISPVFALALGVFARGEPFTLRTAIGLALILSGSWLAAGGRTPTRSSLMRLVGRGAPGPTSYIGSTPHAR